MRRSVEERLKKYCEKICWIDGLETYIVSPSEYDNLMEDEELLGDLKRSQKDIAPFIKAAEEAGNGKLFFSFMKHPNWIEKYEWAPVHCYKWESSFYHVCYRKLWMCRECRNIVHASIIMPMTEAEPIFYSGTEKEYPDISPIFKKVECPYCGRPLQNHLIIWNKSR